MAKWVELSIRTTPEYVEPVSELFRRYGEGGVVLQEEGDWDPDNDPDSSSPPTSVVVMTYLPLDATARSRKGMIEVGIRLISLLQPLGNLQERLLEEDEWETAWKSHFSTLRVGMRLVVKPTWQEYSSSAGELVLELDPGMAFGTGHHPTTRMCLEELERRLIPGMRVLDLGTGSGILAIAAAKMGASGVLALDLDSLAVQAARANARSNGVARIVRTLQGTVPHPQVLGQSYDLILANITARAIADKAQPMAKALASPGVVIASGIIRERQGEAEEALQQTLTITHRRYDGDWVLLVAQR